MNMFLNRRGFLGSSLAVSSVLITSTALASILHRSDAADQVLAILQKNLKISANHRPLVAAFTESLQQSDRHHQTAAAFENKLSADTEADQLELYVVQEFVVSTNFLAYAAGQEKNLVLISV